MNARWVSRAMVFALIAIGCQWLCSCVPSNVRELSQSRARSDFHFRHSMADLLKNRSANARETYNEQVRECLEMILHEHEIAAWRGVISAGEHEIRIDGGTNELLQLDPKDFDEFSIIHQPEGGDEVHSLAAQKGWGIPVVMSQEFRAEKATGKKLFPLNGRHLPATAVLDVDTSGHMALRFYHTRHVDHAWLGGKRYPLAFDLTTPLHRSLRGKLFQDIAFHGLIDSDRYLEDTGIYVPDVYDPEKIPLVFVHGLKSDPRVWQNAMNEVLRDPYLRKKYQCWYFLYPTGLPVYASAAKLRRMLAMARDHYDPSHRNSQMKRMVLVGHSMGGLLGRMQTIDSGEDIYRAFFTRPLEQLPLKQGTKDLIRDSMVFKRVDFIQRVVFVASPHQGSSIAQVPIVRAIGMLVNPTHSLDAVTLDIRLNAHHDLQPELHKFSNMGCRSVQTLSPQHPILKSLQKRPIQVPCHSIIARLQKKRELLETSDGVVAYWSSHVAQAKSECVVHGSHGCTRLPEVSSEILRILRLHVRELNEWEG